MIQRETLSLNKIQAVNKFISAVKLAILTWGFIGIN